jgi:histidine phosphotransferase ChpT
MQAGDLRLGELICARVCHDLGGLAGTLAGTLDLAQDDPGGEAMALARETALALSKRLKLLRAAFGPNSGPLRPADIAELAGGIGDRLQVNASGLQPDPLPEEQARLALAMILLCADALPSGGVVEVSGGSEGALRAVAHGPRAAWRPGALQALDGDVPATSSTFLAPFCALLARLAGMSFSVDRSPPALSAKPRDGVRRRDARAL